MNKVSISQIIFRVQDTFQFNDSSWVDSAKRHIARGLNDIGAGLILERAVETEDVTDYKAPLPCDIKYLDAVKFEDCFLWHSGAADYLDKDIFHVKAKATVDPGYVKTSFETGTVTFYYRRLPMDEQGYPYISDVEILKEALMWCAVYHLLLGGYKHHTITWPDAKVEWEKKKEEARIRVDFPTPYEMTYFADWWLDITTAPDLSPPL